MRFEFIFDVELIGISEENALFILEKLAEEFFRRYKNQDIFRGGGSLKLKNFDFKLEAPTDGFKPSSPSKQDGVLSCLS